MDSKLVITLGALLLLSVTNSYAADRVIMIDKAMYGMGADTDATDGIGKLCNGKTSCSFKVDPGVMNVTDPNPNTKKLLRLSWSCGKDGMTAIEKYDYDTVNLSCK